MTAANWLTEDSLRDALAFLIASGDGDLDGALAIYDHADHWAVIHQLASLAWAALSAAGHDPAAVAREMIADSISGEARGTP